MQPPWKHHFCPVFYTKMWAIRADGKVCEFSKPFGNKVKPRRVHPPGTGWAPNLYTLKGFEPAIAQEIEERFFRPSDSLAATALQRLADSGPAGEWSSPLRSAWSRFLLSTLLRTPLDIEALREHWAATFSNPDTESEARYAEIRKPDAPATFAEFVAARSTQEVERYLFEAYLPIVDNARLGNLINQMKWSVVRTHEARFELLTSDRPLIRTALGKPDGFLAIPIGPRAAFFAFNTSDTAKQFERVPVNTLVRDLNAKVVGQGIKYVYGTCDEQLRFVQNRMGTDPVAVLLKPSQR